MESFCCNCCKDLDLPLRHLIMPEVFLDAHGIEFMRVHGLLDQEFRKNGVVEFKLNDYVYKVPFLQLAFPDVYLKPEDVAFFNEHGLFEAIRHNATVKVLHRCDQLLSTGRCGIYEARPKICRDFDCATRQDCTRDEVSPLAFVKAAAHG